MKREDIAMVCHEVNRAYCEALGDMSQPPWESAPDWQKSSAFNQVQMHLDNPEGGPEASHEAWLKEKAEAGWIYGEVKDASAKTHPCLVPFSQLPVSQKAKDYIFRAVVHACKLLSVLLMLGLSACSHGLQETSFAVTDLKNGYHWVVQRDLVSSRISAWQPHTVGVFLCRAKYSAVEMAEIRQWVKGDHTEYKDCTPISQHENHQYTVTTDQSWATVWQGPLSAAVLAGGLVGMGALWPGDTIVNQNSATGGMGGAGGLGGTGIGGAGGVGNGGNVSVRGYRRW